MNNGKRKILVSLAVAVLTALHAHALTETVNGITWTYIVSNGKASVGGGSSSSRAIPISTSGEIAIPSILGGYPVTSIGECAFWGCYGLRSVTIPNSVTSIGYGAFHGCGIRSVTLPSSVTSIGKCAFNTCSELTSVTIPSSVTSIGKQAFENCSSLASVTIPSSVTNIEDFAFSHCSGLTSVTIPDSVTSIGMNPFRGCNGLVAIVVDEANPVFDSMGNCNAIVHTHDKALIAGCKTTIIPDSVKIICDHAFSGCGLLFVTIPESIACISRDGFSDCADLSFITADPKWGSHFMYSTNFTFTIPDYVTNIEGGAFSGCGGLTAVTIPNSVTNIEGGAFYGCSGLTSVTIPNSVTNIGEEAFWGCNSLAYITIPNSVKSIGERSFSHCGLSSITIPGQFVWEQLCDSSQVPTNVAIASGSDFIANRAFSFCKNLQNVVIPNSVTNIGEEAFCGCSSLKSIAIPDSVVRIGPRAFSYCDQLVDWETIPGVGLVNRWAVGGVITLSGHLDLSGCRGLADGAFSGHSGLKSVTIPDSVTAIGDGAFSSCDGLTSIVVISTNPIYDSRENCNAIIQSQDNTLIAGCKNSIIPDSVTSIGDGAFLGCYGLMSVTIPNSVTNIGDYAFQGCRLSSVTIPYMVTSIGQNAFSNCYKLNSIYLPAHFRGVTATFGLPDTCEILFYLSFDDVTTDSSIIWLSPGDADWFQRQDESRSFIQSGTISSCSTSSIETVLSGPGTITFDWYVSGNRGDYCRLYLDGILQYSITRSPSWATITFGIPDGEHVVGWSYERGSASAAGEDAAFLSNLIWQPLSITVALDATNLVWSTDGDEPWIPQLSVTVDGMAAVQSGPVIGDGVSALRTTLSGPGVLSWSWLLDSSGNAGVDVLLDGVWLDSYAPGSQWTRETLEVTDNGEHTIRFEFWNAGTAATITDCAYIDQVSWTPATPQAVVVCGVDIPTDWLSNEAATILTANGGNYDSAANATAANDVNKVWECYVAGISPTNAAAAFRTIVSFENGVPVIGWEPDLNEGGTKHERVYTVEGKANLTDSWAPTNSASRFFRVKVEMP